MLSEKEDSESTSILSARQHWLKIRNHVLNDPKFVIKLRNYQFNSLQKRLLKRYTITVGDKLIKSESKKHPITTLQINMTSNSSTWNLFPNKSTSSITIYTDHEWNKKCKKLQLKHNLQIETQYNMLRDVLENKSKRIHSAAVSGLKSIKSIYDKDIGSATDLMHNYVSKEGISEMATMLNESLMDSDEFRLDNRNNIFGNIHFKNDEGEIEEYVVEKIISTTTSKTTTK